MLNTSARGCRVIASCSSSKTGHLFPHHFNLFTLQSCCVSGSPFSYGKRKRKPLSQSALNNEDVYADLINFDAPPNATIIDLPKQLVRKDAKRTEYKTKKNVEFYRKYGVDRTRSNTVISAKGLKGADLSHYDGQRYDLTIGLKKDDRKTPVKGSLQLVAEKWLKNTSRGQSFTINQMKRKKSLLDRNDDVADEPDTFTDILPTDRDWVELSKLLEIKCGIVKPTSVQAKSLKPALTGRHVYVAAETGSGKTLCYVLPLMHKIMKRRLTETGKSTVAVILLPTHELAVQVTGVIQSLAERLSHPISVGTAEDNPDIVIGAPQRVANWIERGLLNPESVETAVIDEADTLLDDSFCDSTARALTRLRILNDSATEESVNENEDELLECDDPDGRPRCQVLLASATLTTDLDAALASIGLEPNDVSVICSKHVGYLMHSRSRHTFLRVTAPMKAEQLLIRLRQMLRPPGRNPAKLSKPVKKPPRPSIMIFVNRTMTATWLHEFLDRGFECVLLSKKVRDDERDANFEAFRSGAVPILVCTDVTSRGVDITQVTHVINYDFPVQLVDYVHRAGRVGRVNQKNVTGTIISFVQKRSDVNHVCTIERSIRLGTALRGLDTNTPRLADEHDEMKKRQREAV